MRIEFIFAYVSTGSVLIPLGLSVFQFYRLKGGIVFLFYLLAASLLSDASSYLLGRNGMNTYPIANAYLLFQFIILAWMYFVEFNHSKLIKYIIFLFLIFFMINLVGIQGLYVFNTHSNSVAGLILLAISLYFFYNLLKNLPEENIYQLPMFWISFAVLFYYGGTLLIFLTNNFVIDKSLQSHRLVWILHNFCNIVKNLLFAIALWHNYRNLRHSL